MPKSRTPRPISQHMAAVHALGHATSPPPPPQTRWVQPAQRRSGVPSVATSVATKPQTSYAPHSPGAASLVQGTGSNLTATWTAPAIDGTDGAAAGFNLRSNLSGAGTWIAVMSGSSPYTLSGLAADAAIDVQLQSSNAGGLSTWSATSTLTTATAAPNASSTVSLGRGLAATLP
jgi:hypothetical protein